MANSPENLAPVDFSTHILSIASSAMVSLGKVNTPDGERAPVDKVVAKHLIDVLAMLEAKTKGNLSDTESKLLQSLLADVRLAYVTP